MATPLPPPSPNPIRFDTIPDALAAIRNGESIVVVDDENRENEGDVICAAQFATPQQINFMATEARGLICLAMEGERLDALDLPLMVDRNTDSNQTAFTVSIDAGPEIGVGSGISAEDRPTCAARAMCSPCGPGPAACSNGRATRRRRWIWRDWRGSTRPG
jgi:3,4-dihydroxy 2-butanone 4-phosphate synthase/GTP cyclohydrolase II